MIKLNYNDLSKQAKIGYNALYNVIFTHSVCIGKEQINKFTVPLCLDSNNKVSLTERNFIYFDSVLNELNLHGYYNIVSHSGRAVEDSKTDFSTVEILLSKKPVTIPADVKQFSFTDINFDKLLKRDGKAEKAKTAENKEKKEQEQKAVEEKTAEVEKLKREVAKKNEQLNKKQIDKFNDEALFSIADCVEFLVKKHCPVPADFNFSAFEDELFQVISAHWDLKILDK